MNYCKKRAAHRTEAAFNRAGLSGIPIITPSTYTSKHDPDGKPLLSKYQLKKLNGSSIALAMMSAMEDSA